MPSPPATLLTFPFPSSASRTAGSDNPCRLLPQWVPFKQVQELQDSPWEATSEPSRAASCLRQQPGTGGAPSEHRTIAYSPAKKSFFFISDVAFNLKNVELHPSSSVKVCKRQKNLFPSISLNLLPFTLIFRFASADEKRLMEADDSSSLGHCVALLFLPLLYMSLLRQTSTSSKAVCLWRVFLLHHCFLFTQYHLSCFSVSLGPMQEKALHGILSILEIWEDSLSNSPDNELWKLLPSYVVTLHQHVDCAFVFDRGYFWRGWLLKYWKELFCCDLTVLEIPWFSVSCLWLGVLLTLCIVKHVLAVCCPGIPALTSQAWAY